MNGSGSGTADAVVLNFLPIGAGGGLQNALSFVEALRGRPDFGQRATAVVRRGSRVHDACRDVGLSCIAVGAGRVARLAFEARCTGTFRRGQVCLTLFGPPMLRSPGHLVNVAGCAYSNLFYPEVPFWDHLPAPKRAVKELIDVYRRRVTSMADYWIFETEVLGRRAVELCGFPPERVGVVRMAPSALVTPESVDPVLRADFDRRMPGSAFRILFLSGAHPNKRLHLLPAVAEGLRRLGREEFRFVLTVPPDAAYARDVLADFEARGLAGYVANVGPVPSDRCASLIDACDAMGIFSRLESFSNNYVEAWRMGRPLVATDADWARSECGEAALYVDPADPAATAERLAALMADAGQRDRLIAEGRDRLALCNTPATKLDRYVEHVERARALGMMPGRERTRLRWP